MNKIVVAVMLVMLSLSFGLEAKKMKDTMQFDKKKNLVSICNHPINKSSLYKKIGQWNTTIMFHLTSGKWVTAIEFVDGHPQGHYETYDEDCNRVAVFDGITMYDNYRLTNLR